MSISMPQMRYSTSVLIILFACALAYALGTSFEFIYALQIPPVYLEKEVKSDGQLWLTPFPPLWQAF